MAAHPYDELIRLLERRVNLLEARLARVEVAGVKAGLELPALAPEPAPSSSPAAPVAHRRNRRLEIE